MRESLKEKEEIQSESNFNQEMKFTLPELRERDSDEKINLILSDSKSSSKECDRV